MLALQAIATIGLDASDVVDLIHAATHEVCQQTARTASCSALMHIVAVEARKSRGRCVGSASKSGDRSSNSPSKSGGRSSNIAGSGCSARAATACLPDVEHGGRGLRGGGSGWVLCGNCVEKL